jgi:hypothetical protein
MEFTEEMIARLTPFDYQKLQELYRRAQEVPTEIRLEKNEWKWVMPGPAVNHPQKSSPNLRGKVGKVKVEELVQVALASSELRESQASLPGPHQSTR